MITQNSICPLRPRELVIVQMIANGLMLKEIAGELGVSIPAVHNRIAYARKRVNGGQTTAAFVALALRKGWIE